MREESSESVFVTTSILLLMNPISKVKVNSAIDRGLQDLGGQPSLIFVLACQPKLEPLARQNWLQRWAPRLVEGVGIGTGRHFRMPTVL